MDPFNEPEDEGEGWLVSYADMMTLIACFFILMMAFANFEPVGFSVKAEALSKAFRKEKNKSTTVKLKEITDEIAKHDLKDTTKISIKDSELIVTFSSSTLFPNGEATLNKSANQMLASLIDVIKITNPSYRILIEGHADDSLEKSKYKTQWDLSSARAAYIAKKFETFGFPKHRIVPIGRGDSQKLVKSIKKNGRLDQAKARINRRVVLRLLEPIKKEPVKFGLGIYFKDATTNDKEDQLDSTKVEDYEVEKQ